MDNTSNTRKIRKVFKDTFEENLLEENLSEDEKHFKKPLNRPIVKCAALKQKSYKIAKRTQIWNNAYIERISDKNRINQQQQQAQSLMALRERVSTKEIQDISQFLKKFPQLCGTKNDENTNVTENGMRDTPEYDITEKGIEVDNSSILTEKNDNTQSSLIEAGNLSQNDSIITIESNDSVSSENGQVEVTNKLNSGNETLKELVENGHIHERFVTIGNFTLRRNDLQTLMANNWINDQIINAYMLLIEQRSKQQSNLPQIFALDTYVYQQLVYKKFEDALKWTQSIDIYEYEMIIFPLCVNKSHWCLIVIDLKYSLITYYDSLNNSSENIFKLMIEYLHEIQLHAGQDIVQDFRTSVANVPQQNNFDDCGVFTCMFAEQVSKRVPISYTQKDISEYRFKILKSLLSKKLLDEEELVDDTK